jgi:succinyl-diaminopimelate desuccinylase
MTGPTSSLPAGGPEVASAGSELLTLCAELVATPSVSRHEGPLADRVASELGSCPWLEVTRVGDNVVGRTTLGRARRLVVAGHLDTVPPAGNASPSVDGERLFGVGAADMKGGLAVMLDLARSLPEPSVDVTWCFYACEEITRDESGLRRLWAERPDLVAGDAAVLGEPTDCVVEAGCQGTMQVELALTGERAHTARPFAGRNAIHRLSPALDRIARWQSRRVTLDGCEYAEQMQAVALKGGVAGNVVPDRAALAVNYRFAPDRTSADARQVIDELLGDLVDDEVGDTLTVLDEADGAPPALEDPLLQSLVAATAHAPRAKVGWTDVATFWGHGVPAANFGPGDPLLAHHPGESVTSSSLRRAREVLAGILAS